MTIYLVFEELKAGRLTLATPMALLEVARAKPPSKLGLGPGQGITVEQGLQALVARSANDVAAGFAELISGSEAAFARAHDRDRGAHRHERHPVPQRQRPARSRPAHHGARHGAAGDGAGASNSREYYGYFHTQEFYLGKTKVGPGIKFLDLYAPYADGLKTGFICASGFNIVGSAVRDGRRLIAVAFGFRRADLRDEFIVRLLDEAYALKTGGNRPKIWQLRNGQGGPATVLDQGECGTIRYDMPGDAAWLGTYPRLALGAACLRCRPGRHRTAGLHAARQGMDPAGHVQQGDQAGRHHRRPRARHGAGAVRRLPGAKIVLPGEETPGNHGALRAVLALILPPPWPARRFVRYRRHELADQLRPTQAQGPGLAQGDAGESLAEVPQVRADAVHARLGGQPGGLHPLRPPHAHPAAEAPAAPVRRGQVRAASAAARAGRSAEVPRHQALRRQAQGGPGQVRGPHRRAGRGERRRWAAAPP